MAIAELEDIANQIESGQASIEQIPTLYERASALKKLCTEKLEKIKMSVKHIEQESQTSPE